MVTLNIGSIEQLDYQVSEAFKSLRTNIEFCGSDIKVISVTSATPNEGKSSVAFNLAISMAEAGKKVLFIDADLRKSVMVGRYKITHGLHGLSHFLAGKNEIEEVLCNTNIHNLYMILTGPVPPNPAELLGNTEFQRLLFSARAVYDYIIIDTPPLGSVIDSAIVSRYCDGAIMILESGTISRKFAARVLEQLEKAGCKILGVVLNKVKIRQKGYYGRYYGKYYGKYYGDYYGKD